MIQGSSLPHKEKLVASGIKKFSQLPGSKDEVGWRLLVDTAVLELPELFELRNALFPTKDDGFRPTIPVHTFEVDHIPEKFLVLHKEKGSVHASSFLNYSSTQEQAELVGWIRENVVFPLDFELDHDHSFMLNSASTFSADGFVARGFKVFDVGQDATMTYRVKFVERKDRYRHFDLSGRPDYIITHSKNADDIAPTKADCLYTALCIVEVQSKHRDEDVALCEIQLQLCMFMAMNVNGLPGAIGFLVQDDGMCRTYRATRQPKAIMYEQNDLVHVSHLPEVLEKLIALLSAPIGTEAGEKEAIGTEAGEKEAIGTEAGEKEAIGTEAGLKEAIGTEAGEKEPIGTEAAEEEPIGSEAAEKKPKRRRIRAT